MSNSKGFLGALFDFSFTEFITTKLISALYLILVAFYGLMAAGLFLALASRGALLALVGVVMAPAFFLVVVAIARIGLELAAVLFRSAEYQREVAENTRRLVSASHAQPIA